MYRIDLSTSFQSDKSQFTLSRPPSPQNQKSPGNTPFPAYSRNLSPLNYRIEIPIYLTVPSICLPSKKTTGASHFLKLSLLFPSLFCQFYHAFLPIERHPVFKDIPIPFLPQRFLILLLLDLIQRFITLFFHPLIRL